MDLSPARRIYHRQFTWSAALACLLINGLHPLLAAVPLVETQGRPTAQSVGWYPVSGDLPITSDRFGNGDAFSLPEVYARGEFADQAFLHLVPGPEQRARNFSENRTRQVDQDGASFTEWIVAPKRAGTPTSLRVDWSIQRRPQAVAFTVFNDSEKFVVLQPRYLEIGTVRKWPSSTWTLGPGVGLRINPGERRRLEVDFETAASLQPERLRDRGYDQMTFPGLFAIELTALQPGNTYRLLLGDFAVRYGNAESGEVLALKMPPDVEAGQNVAIEVEAKEIQPTNVLDLELRKDDRSMWRLRLDTRQSSALARDGKIAVETLFPDFLPQGDYTMGLVADGYRVRGKEASVHLQNSLRTEIPEVRISKHKGRQSIFVNGDLSPWIGHASISLQPGDTSAFAEADTHFIVETAVGAGTVMSDEPTWDPEEGYDFASLDQRVLMVLAEKPDAQLVIRPNVALPPRWMQQNEGELARLRTPDGLEYIQETHALPQVSFASEKWQAQQEENLRAMVRHIRQQPWAKNVIGFWICGRPHEWFFGGGLNAFEDYSQPNQAAFHRYAQTAEGLDGVDRKGVQIPSPEERGAMEGGSGGDLKPGEGSTFLGDHGGGLDLHPNTLAGRLTAAYNAFDDQLTARVINRFASAIKEETDGRSIVGCHYGYLFVLPDTPSQGRSRMISSIDAIIDSPHIDFIAGVIVPKHWGLDSHDIYSTAIQSLMVRGKHYMVSNDHSFHLTPTVGKPWGPAVFDPTNVVRGDRYMQQRVVANAVLHGVSPHWFGLRPTWWADKPTLDTISEMVDVFRQGQAYDASTRHEVALVIDHNSYPWLQDRSRFLRNDSYLLYRTLQRTGAPIGTWLLGDVDQIPDSVKTVVVSFAAAPKAEDYEKLRDLLERGGRTIIVVGLPGLIDTTSGEWVPERPGKLLGLPVRAEKRLEKSALVPVSEGFADWEVRYDSSDPWVGLGVPAEGFFTDRSLAPTIRGVVDEVNLVRYEDGAGAYAERPLPHDGRLIWVSQSPINSALWRLWLEDAGVHLPAPLNYVVHAGEELMSVTAPVDGTAEIHFGRSVRVRDLFDPTYGGEGAIIPIPFDRGQTRLMVLEPFSE
jgi:hypothetical protein